MSSQPPKVLDSLRVRVRRLQFIVGLGFFSLVLGSVLTVNLTVRLSARVQALESDSLRLLLAVLLEHLWILGVLPLLCYGAARILELKPLSTALGAAFSGEIFVVALYFVRDGVDGLWAGWFYTALRLIAIAAGVLLSFRAVTRGRAAAAESAAKAQAQAQARKAEYVEFLREAERGAEKSAQREAERATVAAPMGGAAVAVAEAPAPAVVEAAPAPASGEPSAPSPDAAAEPKAPTTEG
ncbi:MAG: hypothetical protein ACJ8AT_36310 [Hyalangium sp.]|uniref:hypothetical protein n=1 Tax=Hyalangium sp. TaxID=2028555 RepID=UPI00389A42DD